ncbi:MAG: hypothetical protein K0R00_3188 [Herbinix sp.]|jgi:hypothetical protein|nr:hypothetical protein [Herbinix sp.]
MIKEALKYIVDLNKPRQEVIHGEVFVSRDEDLQRVDRQLRASSLDMSTLTSLVDYIKENIDKLQDEQHKLIVHVVSPTKVNLISELDMDRKREHIIEVNANLPKIRFNEFIDQESFIIMMQSMFVKNDDKEIVLQVAGNVEDGTVANYKDDGITQKATIKTGLANKDDVVVPNPVNLMPYRTFHEIQQPECSFVFRMKNTHSGVACAIYEADGGAWKNETMEQLAAYLRLELVDNQQVIILS